MIFKTINKIKFKDTSECIKFLEKKNFIISLWIKDIFFKKQYYKIKKPIIFYRLTLKQLGFQKPTTLYRIYKRIKKKYKLVEPKYALLLRLIYNEQPCGEWLRIATPMSSMIDSDGVPHLPKLGMALDRYFIETYWSYKKSIFYPHNEFVVIRK
jgi:hypothetical protein